MSSKVLFEIRDHIAELRDADTLAPLPRRR